MPMSLKCRCHQSLFIIHPGKIVCENKFCGFTEHFLPHETMADIISRMKFQGCYFLAKDMDKLKDGVKVENRSMNYH